MRRFFKTSHGYLYPSLRNLTSLAPISHLHNPVKTQHSATTNSGLDFNELERRQINPPTSETVGASNFGGPAKDFNESRIPISHPWPEWAELMELLGKRGYFGANGNLFENGVLGSEESNRIRTACLNFARDRHGLIRHLSGRDIRVIAGYGCPSMDRKVVNSGKRLRAHVGIEEGEVCGSCNLRGNCERAYVTSREEEGARTVDVMRILLTYGLDPLISTIKSNLCQKKVVKESVRKLLKEMVDYSSKDFESNLLNTTFQNERMPLSQEAGDMEVSKKHGDWNCPRCNFLNFARNIRCLRCDAFSEERLKHLREDQDHLPLKKGDWICEICNFLNFAKNTRCLRCKEKPPKRLLNPGEWECESCNYINFRRNMVCLKCDHRRPKASAAPKPSVQPENDSAGYRQHENETGSSETRGSKMWRFVDEETGTRQAHVSCNQDSGFLDFPIEGGRSLLSRSTEKREKWRMEMVESRKSDAGTRGEEEDDGDGTRFGYDRRRLELLGCTGDDEEMDEWFAQR